MATYMSDNFYDQLVSKLVSKLYIIVDVLPFGIHFIVVYFMNNCNYFYKVYVILAWIKWKNQALKIKNLCSCNTSTTVFLRRNTANAVVQGFFM